MGGSMLLITGSQTAGSFEILLNLPMVGGWKQQNPMTTLLITHFFTPSAPASGSLGILMEPSQGLPASDPEVGCDHIFSLI